ncbi:hypothetical protein ELG83_35410 (plasmid) [Rhizobium leguminosarum]|nr:hypothetical protein EHH54_37745 [Rhizobium leguminosarum]TBF22280.1 hypothetical protein ELG92_35065 [Rhizobium leguminosarum]TBF23712.1 hypothetical protein ELG88_36080 [Rhizobium leguminosarum]TBF47306.1 hypothetical protein ELG91_29535 [Rhizobium leguminosarum]TBF69192.1 hypothetical protein ELG84_29480 [Rhizobium leguminosarum]
MQPSKADPEKKKSIGEISIATPGGRDFGNSRCATGGKQGSRRSLNIVVRRGGGIDCSPPLAHHFAGHTAARSQAPP